MSPEKFDDYPSCFRFQIWDCLFLPCRMFKTEILFFIIYYILHFINKVDEFFPVITLCLLEQLYVQWHCLLMVFGRTLWKSLLLPCFCLRLPFLFFSPKCTIETSARLFSEQKLMTLILNIAFNTQIKSNQIKQCDHTWGKLAIDHALSDKMTTASSSKSNFYFKQEISLINWNVSCPKLRQCKKSCFFFLLLKYNVIDLMSLCCHSQALRLIKTYWVTVVLWMSLTFQATFFPVEAYNTCIHQRTTSSSSVSLPQCHKSASTHMFMSHWSLLSYDQGTAYFSS